MAAPAAAGTSPAPKKRVRVHRRPRLPLHRRPLARLLALFLLAGLLVDLLHPPLPAWAVAAARDGDLATLLQHPACRPASVPAWTALGLGVTGTSATVCWTPSETVSLLSLPATAGIVHASWGLLTWSALNGSATLSPVADGPAGRFRPLRADTRGEPALVVEHVRGFAPARALQEAVLSAAVSGTPWPLVRGPAALVRECVRYGARVLLPAGGRALGALGRAADVPLAGARELAASCRKRRARA